MKGGAPGRATNGTAEVLKGWFLGVEVGKNDGSVKGKSYFKCAEEYGLFLRPSAVEKIEPVAQLHQHGTWLPC
eukprot:Skav218397  [mRNA]  locus=scaffold790:266588:269982:+ [translate_table: standard]